MENPFVIGSEIDKITTIGIIKGIMIDLFKGYPAYVYLGIIEGRFKGNLGEIVRDKLDEHKLIEKITSKELDSMSPEQLEKMPPQRKDRLNSYRLTTKGVDLAISMINLEYSEQTLKYGKEMRYFTITIIVLGSSTLLLGLNQLIFQILQYLH